MRLLVGVATLHMPHEVDWENAIMLALGNRSLIDAIDGNFEHLTNAHDTFREMKELMEMGYSKQKARELLGYEHAKANDIDLDEGMRRSMGFWTRRNATCKWSAYLSSVLNQKFATSLLAFPGHCNDRSARWKQGCHRRIWSIETV